MRSLQVGGAVNLGGARQLHRPPRNQTSSTLPAPAEMDPSLILEGRRLLRGGIRSSRRFYTEGANSPAVISLLLTLAGDIESNPGPQTQYICPVCSQNITSTKRTRGSVQCSSCKEWIHTTCTTLNNIRQHHNTWVCDRCNTITNTPVTPNTTYTTPSNNPPTHTATTTIPNTSQPLRTNNTPTPHTRTRNINILQLNVDGLRTKLSEIEQFLHKHNIHIALLQETKLTHTHKTPHIRHYSHIRTDRTDGHGGGLITYIHKSILYKDTTQTTQSLFQNDTTLEIQSLSVNSGHKQEVNIYNIYIPPDTSHAVPVHYNPQLHPLTQTPNSIIAGDFNAKDTAWYEHNQSNRRGLDIAVQFDNMYILNDTSQYTYIPHQAHRSPSSPDITFCSPSLSHTTTWRTEPQLPADHLPIIITTKTHCKPERSHNTYTNYKKADWTKYTEETEQHFSTLNNTPITNIDKHIIKFNNIILNADKHHIPKGNRRHYNPNFTPEIARLIRQRDSLKHNTPLPHTQDTITRLQQLNREINNKIYTKKTENWKTFVSTLNHATDSSKLYKTLKSISKSQTDSSRTHAAITSTTQHIPSYTVQANTLVNHYANISHLTPTRTESEKQSSKHKQTYPLDHTLTPFTPVETRNIIKKAKNSTSTGPDGISNLHLKHLGPHGIQALTNIANFSYAHCRIPTIWKRGTIITILKPNKDPTIPSSYRPITLLSTPSKITERLILNKITPHVPLAPSQHGFRTLHSTSTLLTNLTQHASDGINSAKPAHRTLLTTIDISKAFDAIPRRKLITKIYNTNMENNTKRWLANYLTGRQAHVTLQGKVSRTRNFPNGVPQGSVLSPTLFNLYMHDIPTPQPPTNIASYADDITITSTHHIANTTCTLQQDYLDTLQTWVSENRLTIAPTKSTTTLITSSKHEYRYTPNITLNTVPVPHTPSTKILGVTYDTGLTFKAHIQDIKKRCTPRLNALRAITGTDFGQHKETLSLLYKQYIRSVMSYASPAWAPTISNTHHNTLQTIQNSALCIITGCTKTTPTAHLHSETRILPVRNYLDMRGTQFYAAASVNTNHPCHYMSEPHNASRNIKQSPHKHYQTLFSTIPPLANPTLSMKKHLHTHFTCRAIQQLDRNTVLQAPPPDIHPSEVTLSRTDRVHLARLRAGHHPSLLSYQYRFGLGGTTDDTCPACRIGPHSITHIMGHCTAHATLRRRHNINGVRNLWDYPTGAVAYLRATGLLGQTDRG